MNPLVAMSMTLSLLSGTHVCSHSDLMSCQWDLYVDSIENAPREASLQVQASTRLEEVCLRELGVSCVFSIHFPNSTISSNAMSSISNPNICEQARNVAIALNNAGVTLLSRQESAAALEMFRDAVLAMKIAAASDRDCQQNNDDLAQLWMRASQRVEQLRAHNECMEASALHQSMLKVVSTSADSANVLSLLVDTPNSTKLILPMSIDPIDQVDLRHQGFYVDNIDLESCILMRNFGLAHAGLAMACKDSNTKELHYDKSYRLLTLAKALFHKLHERDTGAEMFEHVLLFELLLEYDLLQTSIQLGMERFRVIEHNESFQCIIFWIHAQESVIAQGCNSAPAA